jgi:hypothetical protein
MDQLGQCELRSLAADYGNASSVVGGNLEQKLHLRNRKWSRLSSCYGAPVATN